jgi:hypothetical protein
MHKMQTLNILGALAALVTVGSTFAIGTYPQAAHAQTQGMERRDERRDTRQNSRAVKHACNSSSDKSRAECRHAKHDVKQTGRQGEAPATSPGGTTTTPPH